MKKTAFLSSEDLPGQIQNLQIRLLKPDDYAELFSIASDPLIWEMHPDKLRYTEKGFRLFFEKALLDDCCAYLLSDTDQNKVIGSSRLYNFNEEEQTVFIGFTFLSREYWGGIWNAKLKLAMLNLAFRHFKTVFFEAGAKNLRSIASLEKLGAIREPGANAEKIRFRVDIEFWPEIRQILQKKIA